MKKSNIYVNLGAIACFFASVSASSVALAADPDNGADVFAENCGDCHSVSSNVANRKGPSLYRVMGRKAGTLAGARYSPAMVASHIVWNEQTLSRYLANPKAVVPNGTMKFKGLQNPSDRADVIAYLASAR